MPTWSKLSPPGYRHHYRGVLDRKVLSLIPVLSEMNRVHTILSYFFKIYFNIILDSVPRYSKFFRVRLFRLLRAVHFKMAEKARVPLLSREKREIFFSFPDFRRLIKRKFVNSIAY